jgi:siroheme synthase-like protein
MRTYPVMLNLTGRRVVVVGSGPVAMRKVRGLLAAGARVTLIAPQPPANTPSEGVTLIEAAYDPAHLAGAVLVFACTNDPVVNTRIAANARQAGLWVNAVDQPTDCDFFAPARITDDDLVIAIGTGGNAPALAKRLKATLAAALPEQIGPFATALGTCRQRILDAEIDLERRMAILTDLAGEDSYNAFLAGGPDALDARLARHLDAGANPCD